MQYLEYDRKYYILITALRLAAPQALRYLLCAFLLFMGYTLFAVCVFSGTPKVRMMMIVAKPRRAREGLAASGVTCDLLLFQLLRIGLELTCTLTSSVFALFSLRPWMIAWSLSLQC